MNKKLSIIYSRATALLFIALTLALPHSSCSRRPLDLPYSQVNISLSNDYTMPYGLTKDIPYHYAVMMYDSSTGMLGYEDFCKEQGGKINAVPGEYQILTYDLENSTTLLDGRNHINTIRLFTDDAPEGVKATFSACKKAIREKTKADNTEIDDTKGGMGFENDEVKKEPNAIFAGYNPYARIPVQAASDKELVFTVKNVSALPQGRVTIEGVTHTEYLSSVQVFITNIASSYFLGRKAADRNPVTIGFQCSKVDDDSIRGLFNYFGNIENSELLNSAYILFIDTSGGKYLFVTDITGYLNKKNPNANIEIHLEFDVPEPSVGGAGVQPTVDDWNEIWYKYQLG